MKEENSMKTDIRRILVRLIFVGMFSFLAIFTTASFRAGNVLGCAYAADDAPDNKEDSTDAEVPDDSDGEKAPDETADNESSERSEKTDAAEEKEEKTQKKKNDVHDVSYLEDGGNDELYDNLKEDSEEMRDEAKKYAKKARQKIWSKMQDLSTLSEGFIDAYIVVRKMYIPLMLIWFILAILLYIGHKNNKKWQRFAIVVCGITLPVITTVVVFGIPYFVAFMS